MKNRIQEKIKNLKNKGFTLIELIVVIAILGILVLLAAPKFLGYTADAKLTQAKADIKTLENSITAEVTKDPDYTSQWPIITKPEMEQKNADDTLMDKKGDLPDDYQFEDQYYDIPDTEIKTGLDGNLIWDNENGKVIYEDKNNPSKGQESEGDNTGGGNTSGGNTPGGNSPQDDGTDTDGDGVTDYQEGIDGTDETDATDFVDRVAPVISGIKFNQLHQNGQVASYSLGFRASDNKMLTKYKVLSMDDYTPFSNPTKEFSATSAYPVFNTPISELSTIQNREIEFGVEDEAGNRDAYIFYSDGDFDFYWKKGGSEAYAFGLSYDNLTLSGDTLSLPANVNGLPVVAFHNAHYYAPENIKHLVIPASYKKIEGAIFSHSPYLETITYDGAGLTFADPGAHHFGKYASQGVEISNAVQIKVKGKNEAAIRQLSETINNAGYKDASRSTYELTQ